MLEIDRDSTWKDARASYRRLVNRWHPDRYSSRPREKQHAQQRFIEVTKAYDSLRTFYREHDRLPLQNPALRDNQPANQTSAKPPNKAQKKRKNSIEEDIFATEATIPTNRKPRYWLWAIPVLGLIATIAVFAILEKRMAEKQREAAIDVLRNTQPSEFMPKK